MINNMHTTTVSVIPFLVTETVQALRYKIIKFQRVAIVCRKGATSNYAQCFVNFTNVT